MDQDFATKFRTLRQTLGLNQKKMGRLIGVGQQTISALETGRIEPSDRVRVILGLRYPAVFGAQGGKEAPELEIRVGSTQQGVSEHLRATLEQTDRTLRTIANLDLREFIYACDDIEKRLRRLLCREEKVPGQESLAGGE